MSQKISDEELLNDLQRVADELGESPTTREYSQHGNYSADTFINRFGSWNEAKEEAGLEANSLGPKGVDDDELLEDLQDVAQRFGESPTRKQYDEHGQHSSNTLSNRFGSWNQAKEEAGLEQHPMGPEKKASIDEIVEELKHGSTLREIRDKFGYADIQGLSSRLRKNGYATRSRLSKNEANYSGDRWSGLMNIPASTLDELGISSVEDAYYDMEPFREDGDKGVKITFHSERVKQIEEDGGENLE